MGYKVAIWPSIATWGAALAIENIYKILKENDTTEGNFDKLVFVNKKVLEKGSKKVSTFNTQ